MSDKPHQDHEHSETYEALRHGYYQLLERVYARLLDESGKSPPTGSAWPSLPRKSPRP